MFNPLFFQSAGALIFFVAFVFVMLLIFSIPVYFILKVQLRKPAWNQQIQQLAQERNLSHQEFATLPDYMRAVNDPIFANGTYDGTHKVFRLTITHLLHGFMGNSEVTMFHYSFFVSSGFRIMGTAVAFRNSPNSRPILYKKQGNDHIPPQDLLRFIDESFNAFSQTQSKYF